MKITADSSATQSQAGQFPRRSFLVMARNLLQRIPLKPLDINCLHFLMVDGGNHLSMNTHPRFGFKLVRKVFILKLFGKTFFLEANVHREGLASARPESFANTLERDDSEGSWFSKSVAS